MFIQNRLGYLFVLWSTSAHNRLGYLFVLWSASAHSRLGYLFFLWSTSALLYVYSELIIQYYARYISPIWRLTLIQPYWWTGRQTQSYLLTYYLLTSGVSP